MIAEPAVVAERPEDRGFDELQRKTLLTVCSQDEEELGMTAGLRDSARSLSTAALRRYAIAVRETG